MPDPTPAAASPAFDPSTLPSLVATAVAEAMKPFGEQLAKLAAPAQSPTPAPAEAKKGPLTIEDVTKAIGEALASHNKMQSVASAVANYASEKLKDLPEVYRKLLPTTDDVSALAAAEQSIRAKFVADLKAIGVEPKTVGNQAGGGAAAPAAGPVDLSKMSPDQLITQGLSELTTVGPSAATGTGGANPGVSAGTAAK